MSLVLLRMPQQTCKTLSKQASNTVATRAISLNNLETSQVRFQEEDPMQLMLDNRSLHNHNRRETRITSCSSSSNIMWLRKRVFPAQRTYQWIKIINSMHCKRSDDSWKCSTRKSLIKSRNKEEKTRTLRSSSSTNNNNNNKRLRNHRKTDWVDLKRIRSPSLIKPINNKKRVSPISPTSKSHHRINARNRQWITIITLLLLLRHLLQVQRDLQQTLIRSPK